MEKQEAQVRSLAFEMGKLLARFYVAIGHSVRQSLEDRAALKRKGLAEWDTIRTSDRFEFLSKNHALVTVGFRQALAGELKQQAKDLLGFSDKDLEHIARSTPGNPDIHPGVGGTTTPTGTALVGPTVTVSAHNLEVTLGAGVEVDYEGGASGFLAGEEVGEIASNNVKGGGVWIGIRIDC